MKNLSLVALAACTLVLVPGAASAQEGLPVTPDPSECTVEYTLEEGLARVDATPIPGTAAPFVQATPEAFALPDGEPAGEAEVAAITATLRETLACFNTGSFVTGFAFFSDDYIRRLLAESPVTEEDAAFFAATPEPVPAELYTTLVAVREARLLPDGRVGALVETIFPDETAAVQVDFIYFVEGEDGAYLIDEIVEDLEGQYPAEGATPTA